MPRAFGFDEPKPRARRNALAKERPIPPALPLDVLPIIHARALKLLVVQLKAKRLDEVQFGVRGGAQACHVPGVWRNLRLKQYDAHKTLSTKPALERARSSRRRGGRARRASF